MPQTPQEDLTEKLEARVPTWLFEIVRNRAQQNDRTLSGQIRYDLKKSTRPGEKGGAQPLSASTNNRLAEWTPDGYTCPHCLHFNHVTSDEELKDMVGGDPTDSDYLECEHCRKEVKVTPDTVTSFRAERT